MQLSDRITGLFIAGLGAAAAYAGSKLPPVPGQQVGPNVFPMVVGIGMALCGALIMLGVGRHFEEDAQADLAAHSDEEAEKPVPWWISGARILVPPGLLVFYALASDYLGFLITAAIVVGVAARALGASWLIAITVAIGGPVFVSLAFGKLLRVPLPPGLLPTPW